jgi:predicted NACHT family NTPase
MQKADYLLRLMKQRTDALVVSDEKLQQFLMWLNEKSLSVKVSYKPVAVRAFYLERSCARARALDHPLDRHLDRALGLHLDLPLALDHTLDLPLSLDLAFTLNLPLDLALDLPFDRSFDCTLAPELTEALQKLKEQLLKALNDQLNNLDTEAERLKAWWLVHGQVWTDQLRALMIKHRNIGHDWQFSEQQKELLKQYYYANLLLVDCLNNNSDVTPAVRSHIEDTLLLPIALIEQRSSC